MTARQVAFISILFCLTGCTTFFNVPDVTMKNPAHPDAEQGGLAEPGIISENDRLPLELSTNETGAEIQVHEMNNKSVNEGNASEDNNNTKMHDKAIYTCPMHPEIASEQPGKCPKCGMKLVLKKEGGK
jgi:hypothetical protein